MVSWQFGFRRTESVHDYMGVLVPLNQAHLYSFSLREGRDDSAQSAPVLDEDIEARLNSVDERRSGEEDGENEDLEAQKYEENNEAQGMLQKPSSGSEYSVESLKAEMRQGTGGGPNGRWTTYESELCQPMSKRAYANALQSSRSS